jgi:hypothetical protein
MAWPDTEFAAWFELHTIERKGRDSYTRRNFDYYPIHSEQTVKEYMIQLDNLGIPVYMQKRWPKVIRMSEAFPFDGIRKTHGDYFGCSFAWMMAYAIGIGAEEIGFFGVNFGAQEYYYQRPSLERMIGVAEGLGRKIYIDQTSRLLQGEYIYGIGENFDLTYLLHGRFATELAHMFLNGVSDRLAVAIQNPEGRQR